MVKVTCQIRTYGEKSTPDVKIHSHWNERDKVVLEFGDIQYTVLAKDIKAAVDNCTNTAKY